MKYPYEELSDDQFENLVAAICQILFGSGLQVFSTGIDGGRDAKYLGKANQFPSEASPWEGITIIQAKHTNGINRNFSESDFFNEKSQKTILGKEIPKIKKLKDEEQLDNYILFSNRRLSAITDQEIKGYISTQCGIPLTSIFLCGIEQLELWLKFYPRIPEIVNLDPIDSPLNLSPDDLSEVIQAFAKHKDVFSEIIDIPPTNRTDYESKNKTNNLSPDYAKQQLKNYLKDTLIIRTFLAAPENHELMRLYESVVEEFQLKILAKRKDYQTFDEVLEYLQNLLYNRDPVLRQHRHKRLVRELIFYMYWNCDIGKIDDD